MKIKDFLYETHVKGTHQTIPIRLKKFTREYIVELLAKFKLTKGAEIGVKDGIYSKYLCENIRGAELICVDPWELTEDTRSQNKGKERAHLAYANAKAILKGQNAKLIRKTSMDAVRDVPLESLDFVYIDASHEFDNVMMDIIEWSKRVKKGGIVAGHDYYRFADAGVIQAVDTYIYCHKIQMAFITGENEPSWFWVKE